MLLVLDNLEQLTPEVVGLSELLARCPGVRMLVTSREPLHLAAEQQYQVPLLAREDALELFTARARVVAPSVIIERDTVGAVCEQLDRLPLAIELAAARTKVLSPAQILARLEGHLPVLATGPHDAPERQRTLRATIDWSYDLLTDEEQRLFTRLSVFARGSTLDGAEAVCDARVDTLEGLVDQSLFLDALAGVCYWMLQTLRESPLTSSCGQLRRTTSGAGMRSGSSKPARFSRPRQVRRRRHGEAPGVAQGGARELPRRARVERAGRGGRDRRPPRGAADPAMEGGG